MHSSEHAWEQRIRALEAELAASRAELQEFTYTVSHDLRAPLRHVVSFARLLQEESGAQLTGESAGFLRTITDSAHHMGALLDALTALSRLHGVQAVPEVTALAPLVQEVVQEASASVAGCTRVVAVAVDVPPSLYIWADAALVRQALAHVLGNAYQFTATVAAPVVSVSARQMPQGQVQLQVADNGVGFNSAQQDKLFKVFGRLHSAKQFPGLGMGLLMAQRLLAKMGGTISLEPQTEGGAVATLTFTQAPSTGLTAQARA